MDSADEVGFSLWCAASEGNVTALKYALRKNGQVDWELSQDHEESVVFRDKQWTSQAIHVAVARSTDSGLLGYRAVLWELLKARADVFALATSCNANRKRSLQAIHLAAASGALGMLREILEATADPNAEALMNGKTMYFPIHVASEARRPDHTRELLLHHACPSSPTQDGDTALHIACRFGYDDVAAVLLEAGADLDCSNRMHETPLTSLLSGTTSGTANIVKLFTEKGVPPDVEFLTCMMRKTSQGHIASDLMEATCLELPPDGLQPRFGYLMGTAPRTLQKTHEKAPVNISHRCSPVKDLLPIDKTRFETLAVADWSQVDVYVCCVKGACSPKVIKALVNSPGDNVFDAKVVHAIVEEAWQSVLPMYIVDVLMKVIMLILMCFIVMDLRAEGRAPLWLITVLGFFCGKGFLDELGQAVQAWRGDHFLSYAFSRYTVLDWAFVSLSIVGYRAMSAFDGTVTHRGCVGLFCAVQWTRIIYSLRGIERIGLRMLPIQYAVKDTAVFIIIVICYIAAATNAYYIVGARDDPNPLYAASMQIVRLGLLGDFDLFEFEGQDTVFMQGKDSGVWEPVDPDPSDHYALVHVIFYMTAIVITVVLMNLLIGILGANYDLYEDSARSLFLRQRCCLIDIYWERRAWYGLCSKRSRERVQPEAEATERDSYRFRHRYLSSATATSMSFDSMDLSHAAMPSAQSCATPGSGRYLWFAMRTDVSDESLRSIRSVISHQLNSFKASQDREMCAREARQIARIKEVEMQLQEAHADISKQLQSLHSQVGRLVKDLS